jgi:RNA polymerase sigma-70 factor (ECF subfamily)
MSDQTDEQLMQAFREGNPRAFELLLARHERKVWNFLRRSVGDATLAEDLLQEVFLRVIKTQADAQMGDFRGEAKFTTWVYTIARNLCIDHARRAVHRDARSLDAPTRADDEASETLYDRVSDGGRDAEGLASDGQVRARVDEAVAALPPDQREVFLLREVMDMPFAEIAAVVGAPEPTVKSRMRYALERLREALDDLRSGPTLRRSAGPAGGGR